MSANKRFNTLCDNDLFAGFYIVSPTKRIKVLMQPHLCILPDPNTAEETSFLLGHSSNDTNMCRPEYTTADVTKNFISLIDTNVITIPQGFKAGSPFKKVELANLNLPNIMALMTDTNTYRLAALPCCIPIPFGATDTCKGTVTEAHLDILTPLSQEVSTGPPASSSGTRLFMTKPLLKQSLLENISLNFSKNNNGPPLPTLHAASSPMNRKRMRMQYVSWKN